MTKEMTEEELKFHKFFLNLAVQEAKKSPDPSTKCGCVLVNSKHSSVLARGFNSVPDRVQLFDRLEKRPEKYEWVLHGEARAVANAAASGHSTKGSWAYVNWHPDGICEGCAKLLVQAGVKKIIGPNREFEGVGHGEHYNKYGVTQKMFQEAGVLLVIVDV